MRWLLRVSKDCLKVLDGTCPEASQQLADGFSSVLPRNSIRRLASCRLPLHALQPGGLRHAHLDGTSLPLRAAHLFPVYQPTSQASRCQYSQQATDKTAKQSAQESIILTDDDAGALSDKLRPVSMPEAASWSVVILAAYGISATLLYFVATQLFFQPVQAAAFDAALERVRSDFRVIALLGNSIKGHGPGMSRHERQRIPHRIYNDTYGTQHVQVQFHVSGGGRTGVVSADMYKDSSNEWQYAYLYVDVAGDHLVLESLRTR